MGTRGFTGVVVDGQARLSYQQFDSYPRGVGATLLEWLGKTDLEALPTRVRAMTFIADEDKEATAEETERYGHLADRRDSTGTDRYALFHGLQGDLGRMVDEGVMLLADPSWPADSLFCEYGYLVDVDTGTLEVYRGFQTEPHITGRFADLGERTGRASEYHPVRLVGAWPLHALPSVEDVERACGHENKGDE